MNRGTYSATTPHTTIFEVQPPVLPPQGNVGSYQVQSRGVRVTISNWGSSLKSGYESVKVTIENNSGMLFVAASQAFFSLMNVAVKKLNSIDTPVPAFEVSVGVDRTFSTRLTCTLSSLAHFGSNGEY